MRTFKILSIGLLFLSVVFTVNAQTEKGNLLIGGSTKLNFTHINVKLKSDFAKTDGGKVTDLELSPQIGFFIANGVAIGAEVPISYNRKKDDKSKETTTSISFTPFVRYYFGSKNIKPYLHGAVGLGRMKRKDSLNEFPMNLFMYELGGGLAFFLNEKVSLDIGIGYASVRAKPTKDNDHNYRSISRGVGLEMGFVVFL